MINVLLLDMISLIISGIIDRSGFITIFSNRIYTWVKHKFVERDNQSDKHNTNPVDTRLKLNLHKMFTLRSNGVIWMFHVISI